MIRWFLTLPSAACLFCAAAAAESKTGISAEASAGVQYDSNVAAIELDRSANRGDGAGVFEFTGAWVSRAGPDVHAKLSYDFSQSLYFELTDFNVRIHRATADLAYEAGALKAGLLAWYADAGLGGEGFLDMAALSPYILAPLTERLFLRAAYTRTWKRFEIDPARDADVHSGEVDAFFALNGGRTLLSAGYRFTGEDAAADQFDYTAHRMKAGLSVKTMALGRTLAIRAGMRFETRDYTSLTPLIGQERRDDRLSLHASGEIPVGSWAYVRIELSHADNKSDLPSADFNETIAGMALGARY